MYGTMFFKTLDVRQWMALKTSKGRGVMRVSFQAVAPGGGAWAELGGVFKLRRWSRESGETKGSRVPRAEHQRRKLWDLLHAAWLRRVSKAAWGQWRSHLGGLEASAPSSQAGPGIVPGSFHLLVWKTSCFKRNWTEYSERSCPSRERVALDYMLLWSCLTILKINKQKDLFQVI